MAREGGSVVHGISIIFVEEKGVMSMNQKASDQGWQQLQSHIEGFFSQALRSDTQKIEYKPRFIDQLLEMPAKHRQNELGEMST
jgi:CDP-diacylglycerol pyrophosphatase